MLFLALTTWFYDPSERPATWRIFFRGVLIGIPALLVWKLLSFAYNPAWGSFLLVLSFGLKYWLLPYALALGAWCIFYGWSKLDKACIKALTSFLCGFMSLFAIAFTMELWGNSFGAWLIALPLLTFCGIFIMPFAIRELACDYMPSGIRWILAILAIILVSASALALFFLRLEWLAILVTTMSCAGSALFVITKYKNGI